MARPASTRTNRPFSRVIAITVAAAALMSVASGCTSSSSSSRATLYESIDDLARDSSAIVVGTVTAQRQDEESTISTLDVSNAPTNPQLGADLDSVGSVIIVGDTVEVRQAKGAPPGALLETDQEYLLFLTPTMLPGDATTQYFVTGAEAGLCVRDGDEFHRMLTETGDTLPATISMSGNEEER